jgi:hypothetical protein
MAFSVVEELAYQRPFMALVVHPFVVVVLALACFGSFLVDLYFDMVVLGHCCSDMVFFLVV